MKKETAYNLKHLNPMDFSNYLNMDMFYKTIEFRQHHGTLDSDEISNWVQFCVQPNPSGPPCW